jgi:exonuclease SbcD
MRLLHTSDWHLGRTLHGYGLQEAQEQAIDFIVDLAISRSVDVVVVAGDIFDRAIAPIESLRVFNGAIERLAAAGIIAVVTAGNHDSGDRLAIYSGVLQPGVHVVGSLDEVGSAIEIADEFGSVSLYPLPYLDPDIARDVFGTPAAKVERSHEAVMGAALDLIEADIAARKVHRAVGIGHAFVASVNVEAQTSESERDLTVGGVQVISTSVFAGRGLTYVALGHLHRQQVVQPTGPMIAYSGSLLRYSISEALHTKCVLVVEIGASGNSPTIEIVDIPQPRPMSRLRGGIDELLGEKYDAQRDHFVELIVTDTQYPDRMHVRLDEVFPFALRKLYDPEGRDSQAGAGRGDARGKDPLELIGDFYTKVTGAPPAADEAELLRAVYEAVRGQAT